MYVQILPQRSVITPGTCLDSIKLSMITEKLREKYSRLFDIKKFTNIYDKFSQKKMLSLIPQ